MTILMTYSPDQKEWFRWEKILSRYIERIVIRGCRCAGPPK
jgi:hypothetical protein